MVKFRFSKSSCHRLILGISVLSLVTTMLAVVVCYQGGIKDRIGASRSTAMKKMQYRRKLLRSYYDPRSISQKTYFPPGSVAAVFNTPKCGTDTLANSFVKSFECGTNYGYIGQVLQFDCPEQRKVLRTHELQEGMERIRDARSLHPERNCMVVTAIRNPQVWLASLYMQTDEGYSLCDEYDITREDFVQKYRDWIVRSRGSIQHAITALRPPLLKMFGAQSLADEFMKMNTNGGYSILNYPSSSTSSPTSRTTSPFTNCQLLFLRMEDSKNWSNILSKLSPSLVVNPSPARADRCPAIAAHYHAIKNYKLTEEEKSLIVGGNVDAAEYFEVYTL